MQIFLLCMYSMHVGQKVPYGRKVSEDWQAFCQHAALLKQHAITPSETLTVPKTHGHKCQELLCFYGKFLQLFCDGICAFLVLIKPVFMIKLQMQDKKITVRLKSGDQHFYTRFSQYWLVFLRLVCENSSTYP